MPLTYVSLLNQVSTQENVVLDGKVIGTVVGRPKDRERPFHAALNPLAANGLSPIDGLDLIQGFGASRDAAVQAALASGAAHAAQMHKAVDRLSQAVAVSEHVETGD